MNDLPKMKGLVQQHNEYLDTLSSKDEKDYRPEMSLEPIATSRGLLFYGGRENIKKFKELFYKTEVFTNENGTVYKTIEGCVPDGATALSIEGQIYYSSFAEVQALQDFLSLRVQKAKEAEDKFKKTFTPIKKNRNKMLHLTPKKKKR